MTNDKLNMYNVKNKILSKYKKSGAVFLHFEGQMHLYPCVYLYFYAIIVMKQYLITYSAYVLQIIRLF